MSLKNVFKIHEAAGRCNCENAKCTDHKAGACPRPGGSKKAMYVGALCDQCAAKMDPKFLQQESPVGGGGPPDAGDDSSPEEMDLAMAEAPVLADFSKKAQAFSASRAGGLLNTTLVDTVEALGGELDSALGQLYDDGGQIKNLKAAWDHFLKCLEEIGGAQ